MVYATPRRETECSCRCSGTPSRSVHANDYKHFHTANRRTVSVTIVLIIWGYFTEVKSDDRLWSNPKGESYILRTLRMRALCPCSPHIPS